MLNFIINLLSTVVLCVIGIVAIAICILFIYLIASSVRHINNIIEDEMDDENNEDEVEEDEECEIDFE